MARAAVRAADDDRAIGRAYQSRQLSADHAGRVRTAAGATSPARHADLVHIPRAQIERLGGQLFAPPYYFGVYLDIPPIVGRRTSAPGPSSVSSSRRSRKACARPTAGIGSRRGRSWTSPGRIVCCRRESLRRISAQRVMI